MKIFYGIMRLLITIPTRILYPAKVINKKNNIKNSRSITISNHLKWIDILYLAVYIPGYRHFIAKKQIGKNILIRIACKWLGVILLDREAIDISTIRKSLNVLKKNDTLTLFPEGTRNKVDENLQDVKSGAAMFSIKGKAPIVPILIHHKAKLFNKNYIYIDEPFTLEDYYGKLLDGETLENASMIVSEKMLKTKSNLTDYVDNIKLLKANKKLNKRLKK